MDSNNSQNTCGTEGCKCNHHMVTSISVMLIGVTLLLQTFNVFTPYVAGIIWPILLIIAAGGKLCKCCK